VNEAVDLDALLALPVLSIRQPWASYVVSGLKSIELRSWATDYHGWLWIHAGKQIDLEALSLGGVHSRDFRTGGLLGIAHLTSCALIRNESEWMTLRSDHRSPGQFVAGTYAWRFSDAVALDDKIDSRGELRLFWLDPNARANVRRQLRESSTHSDFLDTLANVHV
jgi:hypothetical protein